MATAAATRSLKTPIQFSSEHGSQIFVYTHLRTRQTIYSLSKFMTKESLQQLTFVGKKSVPATLRKDMWKPLCVLNFPNRFQGLHAFARLREFRERHETEWPLEEFTVKKGPHFGQLLPRKERTFKLMDQRANSIADMAAVLAMQARPPESWLVNKMSLLVDDKKWETTYIKDGERKRKVVMHPAYARAKKGQNSKIGHRVFEFQGKIDGTSIWWADLTDAEYAETWPAEVVHGNLAVQKGHPVWPPLKASIEGGSVTEIPDETQPDPEPEKRQTVGDKIWDARRRAIKVPRIQAIEDSQEASTASL